MALGVFTGVQLGMLSEIGLVILLATILALVARFAKQPLIPAYIMAGAILGPIGLGILQNTETIRFMSEMGIAFLLFVVGLEVNIKKLKSVGVVTLLAGFLQTSIVFTSGFFIATSLGFAVLTAIYLGLVLAFSSTMVVIKLLSDSAKVDTMHGRIIIGILLVQDLIAMLAIGALVNIEKGISLVLLLQILTRGLVLVAFAYVLARYIFPKIFRFAAKQKELLFLISVTTCFIFAMLAFSLKFSIAIGAFIAGVALGTLPYSVDIKGRVEALKDFFATIFFVSLGAQLVLKGFFNLIDPLLIFLAVVILLKPFVLFLVVSLFGYTNKVAFQTAISLAQISEFGLILVTIGLNQGHISQEVFSLTVILAIISIILTSYFIKHAMGIHIIFAPVLKLFDKFSFKKQELSYKATQKKESIIIFGCNRMGTLILRALNRKKDEFFIVDNNPEVIKRVIERKIACMYGDATSREVLETINLAEAKMIISTIPKLDVSSALTQYIRLHVPDAKIIVTVEHVSQAFTLYDLGADYVIVPHVISGEIMADTLPGILKGRKSLAKLKKDHLKELEELDKLGFNH